MSSNGTLSKSQDYKQMVANGSIDSMDKSVLSSEQGSFEGYDQKAHYNEYVNQHALRPTAGQDHQQQQPHKVATISKGSAHRARAAAAAAALEPDAFELSYRNEGFRDNSTYGGGTRANSISTSVAEDTPIIHHTDAEAEEVGSDYYGNASTLPLRTDTAGSSSVGGRRGQPGLAFLSELKQNLPEYQRSSHSSFMQPTQRSSGDSLPFDQKLDQFNYSTESSLYRPAPAVPQQVTPADMRRPDSYYTAVRSSKAPTSHYRTPRPLAQPPAAPTPTHASRPKTVYQTAAQEASSSVTMPTSPTARTSVNPYHRSKSEALLETDFDSEAGEGGLQPLSANGRSHSQPLETAM